MATEVLRAEETCNHVVSCDFQFQETVFFWFVLYRGAFLPKGGLPANWLLGLSACL